jgi:hypothetical protein
VTSSGAFVIPNVAPDTGLSAPYNSWFTLFGSSSTTGSTS